MVSRVLLNSSGLKISQPGVDVLSAGNSQLQFSSDWSGMGLVQQGYYSVASYSGQRHDGFVPLVKTFSTPPFCIFMLDRGSYYVPLNFGFSATLVYRRSGGTPSSYSSSCLVIEATTTAITFRAMYFLASGGVPIPTYGIPYYVFDNNQ